MPHRTATLDGAGFTVALSERALAGPNDAILEKLDGWHGGAGVEGDNPKRPLGHGLFFAPSTRAGLPLTLGGVLVLANAGDRDLAARLVAGVAWDGELAELTVTDAAGLTLSTFVKLDGAPKVADLGPRALRFELPLLAPDPFLVGEELVTTLRPSGAGTGLRWPLFGGGAVTFGEDAAAASPVITNAGTATAWPVAVVRGAWPGGFRLVHGTAEVAYPYPVAAASPVTVDTAAGAVLTNEGADVTYRATRRQWDGFAVPAGGAIRPTVHALADSTGWVDVHHRDTYA